MPTLQVQTREKASTAAANRLRGEGHLPMALLSKTAGTRMIVAPRADIKSVLNAVEGLTMFDVKVDAEAETRVILKDVQRDPVSRRVTHITLQEIAQDDVINVPIPVKIVGEPRAVAKRAATLIKPVNELKVKAKVADLPDEILVDISKLKQNDRVTVGMLNYPALNFLTSKDTVIAATKQLRGMTDYKDEEETPAAE